MKVLAVLIVLTDAGLLAFFDYIEAESYRAQAIRCAERPDTFSCEIHQTSAGNQED